MAVVLQLWSDTSIEYRDGVVGCAAEVVAFLFIRAMKHRTAIQSTKAMKAMINTMVAQRIAYFFFLAELSSLMCKPGTGAGGEREGE
jgi:hypothetical protein